MSTASTIRIKLGPIEVECAASEAFLKEELPVLMQSMVEMHRAQIPPNGEVVPPAASGEPTTSENANIGSVTTKTIAAALGAKTGPELVLAACFKLSMDGGAKYGRKEIHNAMKEASGFYKTSFQANLSQSLNNLVKAGDLLEVSKETYALSVNKQNEMKGRVGSVARP